MPAATAYQPGVAQTGCAVVVSWFVVRSQADCDRQVAHGCGAAVVQPVAGEHGLYWFCVGGKQSLAAFGPCWSQGERSDLVTIHVDVRALAVVPEVRA